MEAFFANKGVYIVYITEDWLTNEEINIVQIQGYKQRSCSAWNLSREGGTAIFVRETICTGDPVRSDYIIKKCIAYYSV